MKESSSGPAEEPPSGGRFETLKAFRSAGRGFWSDVPDRDWNDWRWQLKHRVTTTARLQALMPTLTDVIEHYNYIVTIFLMMAGLYIVVARGNMVKKLVGLSIFQTSVYLLYIEPGKILGGTAPIIDPAFKVYSNPLPHVLILTAIVVGVATLALGLALVVRINEAYGTIEEDEIFEKDRDK